MSEVKNKSEQVEKKEELTDSEVKSIEEVEADEKKASKEKSNKLRDAKQNVIKKSSADFLKSKKAQRKKKALIIWAVVLILAVAGIFFIKKQVDKAKKMIETAMSSNQETATVEKKTLKKTVSATGTLLSKDGQTVSTILQSSSKIVAVNVEVGDYVEEGEVLVIFSTEDIEKQISQTKEDIATQKQTDAIEAADNQRSYVYQYGTAANTLESDAQSVEKALKNLYEACDGYGDAKRKRDDAKNLSEEEYTNKYGMRPDLNSLENAVTQAYQQEQSAKEAYEAAIQKQAQSLYSQQNSLATADSSYQKANISAGSRVKEYERTLEKLNDNLDNYVVTAPMSGIVTQVNVSEGNSFANGSVLTIQDMSNYDVDINIDEYDIYSVKKAFEEAKAAGRDLNVVIKTEATEDDEFDGHVKTIAPTSTTTATYSTSATGTTASSASSSSTPQYKVTVELDEMSDVFMVGMTAKVAIIVEESPENSLCVPYNAVDETSDGEFVVHVSDGDTNKMPEGKFDAKNKKDSKESDSGIVVENSTSSKSKNDGKPSGMPSGGFGRFPGGNDSDEETDFSEPKYHDVKVKKIFDTDYYTAIVPVNDSELKEGDTVVIVSTKNGTGNDLMNMFGGGPDEGPGPR